MVRLLNIGGCIGVIKLEDISKLDISQNLYFCNNEEQMYAFLQRKEKVLLELDILDKSPTVVTELISEIEEVGLVKEEDFLKSPYEMGIVTFLYCLSRLDNSWYEKIDGRVWAEFEKIAPWANKFADYLRSQPKIEGVGSTAQSSYTQPSGIYLPSPTSENTRTESYDAGGTSEVNGDSEPETSTTTAESG